MKIIINEIQKGLLFKDGKFVKMLDAGKYHCPKSDRKTILILPVNKAITEETVNEWCGLDVLLQDGEFASNTQFIDVKDDEIVIHFVNEQFTDILSKGRYIFWEKAGEHSFRRFDTSIPELPNDISSYAISVLKKENLISCISVMNYEKCLLYYDKKFVKILDAGVYYFWKGKVSIDYKLVDTRLIKMDIIGQEILTQDKVSIRVNMVCNYQVRDYVKIFDEFDNYKEHLHITAQLAIREYVGKRKIDEILDNKEDMSKYISQKLKEKGKELYLEVTEASVKDIILPGDMRDIMNTVLIAEKKAQANVIARREEVASTRSLLNTAKLMEENKTLYKLKELEYIERICENVGNVNINGGGDILSQLVSMLDSSKKQ